MSKWQSKDEFKECVRDWAQKLDVQVQVRGHIPIQLDPQRVRGGDHAFADGIVGTVRDVNSSVTVHRDAGGSVEARGKVNSVSGPSPGPISRTLSVFSSSAASTMRRS